MIFKKHQNPEFTAVRYKEILHYWKGRFGIIPLGSPHSEIGILLRHDIDDDLDRAVRMAELEAGIDNDLNRAMFQHGDIALCRSTYFALNTAKYWKSKECFEALRYIQDLGHEIGWHNNALASWYRSLDVSIRPHIIRPLDELRSHGLIIKGTAAHGDRLCREFRFMNYNIWGLRSPGWPWSGLQFGGFKLEDFGLEYEAYHIPFDDYLTDNGGRWCKPFEDTAKKWIAGKRYQVIIHPQHWDL